MIRALVATIFAAFLVGCASPANPRDPIEPFNRAVFSFNEGFDRSIAKPVAEGYRSVVPAMVRTGISNFFANLEDLWIAVNNLLQGKVQAAGDDFGRFVINSSIGLFGLIDVASDAGLEKHNEDFGQTLATWGVGSGPYVVLPLFGATTLRDGLSRFTVDWLADPVVNINHVPTRNTLYAERVVSNRADVIGLGNVVEEAALDKYSFNRDAYLQRRESLIHDGNPPRSPRAEADVDEPSRSPTVVRVVTGTYPTPALLSELSANMAPTVVTDGEGRPVSIGSSDAPLLTRSVGGL